MRHLMIFILENLFRLSNMSNHGRRNFQNLILSFHQLIELVFRVNIIESKFSSFENFVANLGDLGIY